jgi:hypothetical protein
MHNVFLILGFTILSQTTSPLESLKWKNRILIINQDEATVKKFKDKMDAVQDRDIIIFYIDQEALSSFPKNIMVSKESLVKYYDIKLEGTESILIGKDGGIKLRKQSAAPKEIFDLIDSMPMRQSEMRKKSGG